MDFRISGLPVEPFIPFFAMSDAGTACPRCASRRRHATPPTVMAGPCPGLDPVGANIGKSPPRTQSQ